MVRVRKVAVLADRVDLVAASEVPVDRAAGSVFKVGQGAKADQAAVVEIVAAARAIKDEAEARMALGRIVHRSSCQTWK